MPYPAKKNDKLTEEVLSRIALGETLSSISRDLNFHPTAWSQWLKEDEPLRVAYAEAREVGADIIADNILEIVDTPPERHDGKIDNGSISWARNRADFRLKLLGHWRPEKYGGKENENSKKDGKDVPEIDTDELMLRLGERLLASKRDTE